MLQYQILYPSNRIACIIGEQQNGQILTQRIRIFYFGAGQADIDETDELLWPTLSVMYTDGIQSLKSLQENIYNNISIIIYLQKKDDTIDTLIQVETTLKRLSLNKKIPYLILLQNQQIASQILNSHDNSQVFMMYTENSIKHVYNRIFQFIENHLDSLVTKKKEIIQKLEHSLNIKQSQLQLNQHYFEYLMLLGQIIITIEPSKLQKYIYQQMKIYKLGYFSILLSNLAFMKGESSKYLDSQTRSKILDNVKEYMLVLQKFYTILLEQIEHNPSVEIVSLFNTVFKVYSEILRIQSYKFIQQQLKLSLEQQNISNKKIVINMQQLPPDQNVFNIFQQTFKVICKIFRPDVGVFSYLNQELLNQPETDEKIAAITINNNNYKIFLRFHCITLIASIIYAYAAIFILLLKILYSENDKINDEDLVDKVQQIVNMQNLTQSIVQTENDQEISQEYKQLILQYPSSFYIINLINSLASGVDQEHWEWISKLKGAIINESINIPPQIQFHQIIRADIVNNFEIDKGFQIAFDVLDLQNFNQIDFRSIICFLYDHVSKMYSLIPDQMAKEYSIKQQQKYSIQLGDENKSEVVEQQDCQNELPYINIMDLRSDKLKTYTHEQLEDLHQKLTKYNTIMPHIYQCINKLVCRIVNILSIQFPNNMFQIAQNKIIDSSVINKITQDLNSEYKIIDQHQNNENELQKSLLQYISNGDGFIFLHQFKLKLESYKLIFEVKNSDIQHDKLRLYKYKMESRIFDRLILFLISSQYINKEHIEPIIDRYFKTMGNIEPHYLAQLYMFFPENQQIKNKLIVYNEKNLVLDTSNAKILIYSFINGCKINAEYKLILYSQDVEMETGKTENEDKQTQQLPNQCQLCFSYFSVILPYFPISYIYELVVNQQFYSLINNTIRIIGPNIANFVPCKIVKNDCGEIKINKNIVYPFEVFHLSLQKENTIQVEYGGEIQIQVNTQIFSIIIKPLIIVEYQEIEQNVYKVNLQKELQKDLRIISFNNCKLLTDKMNLIFKQPFYLEISEQNQSIELVMETNKIQIAPSIISDKLIQYHNNKQTDNIGTQHFTHIKMIPEEKPDVADADIIVLNLNLPYQQKLLINSIYPEIIFLNQLVPLKIEVDSSKSSDILKKIEYIVLETTCDDIIVSGIQTKILLRDIFNNNFNSSFICMKVGRYRAIKIMGIDNSGEKYLLNYINVTVI